jgi:hypothetical protein
VSGSSGRVTDIINNGAVGRCSTADWVHVESGVLGGFHRIFRFPVDTKLGGSMKSILCLLAMLSVAVAQQAPTTGSYRITHTYTLGGDGSWESTESSLVYRPPESCDGRGPRQGNATG